MPNPKMRVELFDKEGNKYTISFEGRITREKAVRILDLVELFGGMSSNERFGSPLQSTEQLSKYDKIRMLIQKHFPIVWFSSKDVQNIYEQEFQIPIILSTVSTYLARLTSKGFLTRVGRYNNLRYKLATQGSQIQQHSIRSNAAIRRK
jgi:hypothetical protein